MNEARPVNIVPIIIGMALTGLLLAGITLLSRKRESMVPVAPPMVRIVAPAPAATIDSPLVLRFSTAAPLELKTSGWGHADFHLHAWIDGVEVMPAVADITSHASSEYEWVLPGIHRGDHRLFLAWADQHHRPITASRSDTISIAVQ